MRQLALLMLLLVFVTSATLVRANDRDAEKETDSAEAGALVTVIAPGKRLYGKQPEFAGIGHAATFDLSPDGKKIAFMTSHGIQFWDIEKNKLDDAAEAGAVDAESTPGIHSPGQYFQYSNDGKKLFTSRWSSAAPVANTDDEDDEDEGADYPSNTINVNRQIIEIRDADGGKVLSTIEPEIGKDGEHRSLRFMLPTHDGDKVLLGYGQKTEIYDTETGELLRKLKHKNWIQSAVFDHTGERLIDGNGKIIDVETGETEGKLPRMIFGSYLNSIKFHPKRNIIATSEWNQGVILYDMDDKEKLELEASGKTSGQYMYLTEFSRDGELLAGATYVNAQTQKGKPTIVVWDVETGKIVDEITLAGGHIARFRISPDKKLLFVKAHGQFGMSKFEIDGDRKKQNQTGPALTGTVQAFQFADDDEKIIASPTQGNAVVFDLETGTAVNKIASHNTSYLEVSESGRYVVLGANYGGFKIHDRKSRKTKSVQVKTYAAPSMVSRLGSFLTRKKKAREFEQFGVGAVTVAEDEKHVMVTLRSALSFRWQKYRIDNGKSVEQKRFKFEDYWDCDGDETKNTLASFQWMPTAVTISPDSQYLAVVGPDKKVNVIDADSGNESHEITVDDFTHGSKMFFSRDSQKLLVKQGKKIRIFDLESGEEDEGFSISGEAHHVGISRDRTKIALLRLGDGVTVYDLETGEETFSCKVKKTYVSLAVSNDGEKLAFARQNCQFEVWDTNEIED